MKQNSLPLVYTILGVLVIILILYYYKDKKRLLRPGRFPVLSFYSRDLTKLAAAGQLDPVIGRDEEIKRVIQILSRRTKNNPVLLGKAGVGKTAIVEGLAQKIAEGNVPELLKNKKVLGLDLSGIVAGTKYRGEFEQRLKKIADEIIASNRSIILFIDEIHSLAEAGEATGALDADDILKPPLARGDLQVVGATTPAEYEKTIKKDATLDRRLQPVYVKEPTAKATIQILEGIKNRYEKHHQVKITSAAVKKAVAIADKYLKDRCFPDKAIDLIDEAASKVKLESIITTDHKAKKIRQLVVGPADVLAVFKEMKANR